MRTKKTTQAKPLKGLFIGVDGATDDVIGPMMEQGRLPHFTALRRQGAYGRLKSQPGYSSPALWTTIESGYRPEEHGILGFGTALRGNLRKPRIHERLQRAGWKVGLCRMFCNWPPERNEVFVIPSFADVTAKVHPKWVTPLCQARDLSGLREKAGFLWRVANARLGSDTLRKLLAAGLAMRHAHKIAHEAYYLVQRAQHWLYCRIFCRLVRDLHPDYAALLIGIADSVGHRYWHYHHALTHGGTTGHIQRLGGIVEAAYADIDEAIGEALALTDADTIVVIASDHGMELVGRAGDNLIPTSSVPDVLDLPGPVEGYYPGLYAFLAPEEGGPPLHELLSKLAQTRLVSTGQPLFDPCRLSGNRVVFGISQEVAWDPAAKIESWGGKRLALSALARREPRRPGDHGNGPDGILLLKGPGIRKGAQLLRATQFNVAPTVLALLGMPIPENLQEGILADALVPGGRAGRVRAEQEEHVPSRAVQRLDASEKAVLEQRLRDLGYID